MIYLKMPNGAEYNIEGKGGLPKKTKHTTGSLAAIVSEYTCVPIEEMKSNTRKREAVEARQMAMYLARFNTTASLHDIGHFFGKRDHSSVVHSIETVKDLMFSSPGYRRRFALLKNLIN